MDSEEKAFEETNIPEGQASSKSSNVLVNSDHSVDSKEKASKETNIPEDQASSKSSKFSVYGDHNVDSKEKPSKETNIPEDQASSKSSKFSVYGDHNVDSKEKTSKETNIPEDQASSKSSKFSVYGDHNVDSKEKVSEETNIPEDQASSKSSKFLVNGNHNVHSKERLFEEHYPGLRKYSDAKTSECNVIMPCPHNIQKGYWFGNVSGKLTATFCPINYCNFTCCKASNGEYQLLLVEGNQCRSHRSGVACGTCADGYTLSFDSTACVSVESCTTGQTILVILLTVAYWIVMGILLFVIMHYEVTVGYLYCITYYYSVTDILLSQNLHASRELNLLFNILSSFSKITPQFLGEFCLTTGMSGIDQQFIHYIHPLAVIVIIVIISLKRRKSPKFGKNIGRDIIHMICSFLLLSFTSVASTSLLLIAPLKFYGTATHYTYLSPNMEYFHGRHLAYFIVALLILAFMVLGLFSLVLHPFLSQKFKDTNVNCKILMLLDQFQGCYKDTYQYFAAYYMFCRLMIMFFVIFLHKFIHSYVLIFVCGIISILHVTVNPYSNEDLNKFDSVLLYFIFFIGLLPFLDDFDILDDSSPSFIIIAFILVVIPVIALCFAIPYIRIKKKREREWLHYIEEEIMQKKTK